MSKSSASVQLKRTALYNAHLSANARIVEFAGWAMPIQYNSILEEHRTVRSSVGIFDVSHMGRVYITGDRTREFLQRVLVSDVTKLGPGAAQYTFLCNEDGGILDDAVLYMLEEQRYLLVCNAANTPADLAWLERLLPATGPSTKLRTGVEMDDRTARTVMMAVQGPQAAPLLKSLIGGTLVDRIEYFKSANVSLHGMQALLSRTGYTGEDGFEIVIAAEGGEEVWNLLVERGARPCGLGSRDTLRLEACLPLHGSDIGPDVNPFEAGLGWVVDLEKGDFLSRPALEEAKRKGPAKRLVALELLERAIPRHGYSVINNDQAVGTITSGGFSPTLEKGIALAYVPAGLSKVGIQLEVDIRGKQVKAAVARRPFYRRGY